MSSITQYNTGVQLEVEEGVLAWHYFKCYVFGKKALIVFDENLLCWNFEEFLLPLVSSYYYGIYTNLTLQSLTKNVRQTLVFM